MATSPYLRYPIKSIGPQDDYFKISVLKYEPPGLGATKSFALRTTEDALSQSGSIKNALATIILPMPQGIQDTNATDWVSGTMNPLSAAVAETANTAVRAENAFSSIGTGVKTFGSNVKAMLSSSEGKAAVAAYTAAQAAMAITGQGDVNQVVSRATGQVFNQNVELLFNGVQIRPAFSFTFDMVPRSQPEALAIKEIIRTLKKNMTAAKGNAQATGGGFFIKAPQVFKLEYMSGGKAHPFLHRFKPCALTQMSVNYNASAQYATYPDATPIHMQMTLQFQELSPIYQEDYGQGEGAIGVGY